MRGFFGAAIGVLALLVLAGTAADRDAWSQTGRTIRIVLGVPPGGSIDFLARLLADQISNAAGLAMIVESKPGAGGIIAVGSSRVDLQACKLEYSIVSPK